MDFEDVVADLETFGLTIPDETTFAVLRYAIENEQWDPSTTIDELISEATNSKITKIDNNFISQFIKKLQEVENQKPVTKITHSSKFVDLPKPKIEPVKIESSDYLKGIVSSEGQLEVKLTPVTGFPEELSVVPLVPGLTVGGEVVIDQEMMNDVEEIYISGRIYALPEVHGTCKAMILSPYYGKKMVDLSAVNDAFIFNEQMVQIEGVYEAGVVKAKKIVTDATPPLAPVDTTHFFANNQAMFFACGPFNDESDIYPTRLNQLFFNAKERKARLVVLFGPVLTFTKSVWKKEATISGALENFFETLSFLTKDFDGTVVVVPGAGDDICIPCCGFPSTPYECLFEMPKVHLLPNPCVFKFSGLTIALINHDALMTLAKSRLITQPEISANRLQAFLTDMLSNGLILPSQAGKEELVNCKFNEMPHIIVSTSKLPRFATKCCESFYVNLKHSKGNPGVCFVGSELKTNDMASGCLKISAEFLDK
uniref:DNA polymerase alpha subunit B n=1 Tax=Panagrolaimus sp. JU765 TaxID=591449 RepID=A0AC34Q5Z8_9BILA